MCLRTAANNMPSEQPRPPRAKKVPHQMVEHGHTRNDEYFWMRLSEEQRHTPTPDAHTREVVAHLEAENAYADELLGPVKELREALFEEMKARVKEDDLSVPYRENGFWYNHRFEKGKEYAVHMRGKAKPDGGCPEKLDDFINENTMAEGHDYFDRGLRDQPRQQAVRVQCGYGQPTIVHHPLPRSANRRGTAGRHHQHQRRGRMGR